MKKTMRLAALLLVLCLFAGMAMGSGSSSSGEIKEPSAVSGGNAAEQNTTADAQTETQAPAQEPKGVTVEETVLLDAENVKITAKSFDAKGIFGPSLKLLIENNSDKTLTVQTRGSSVNGYMVETMLSPDVAAGKKANEELIFMDAELDMAGITTVADMEFRFHIFDTETWDTYLDTDPVVVKTSAAEGYSYSFDNSGYSVYSENGVEIVVKGLADASIFGPGIVVYINNTGAQDICVQTREVSINGFMMEPMFSPEIAAGKHAVHAITFFDSELEENDITAIEEVELSFHIFDNESWDTIADTDPITITFEN